MITTLIAVSLISQGQTPKEQPRVSAAAIVSKMFSYYDPAKVNNLAGTVRLTQSAAGVSLTIDTRIQFERPSKLYLHQARYSKEPKQWVVTSDGKWFTFPGPEKVNDVGIIPPRLREPVAQKPNEHRTVGVQTAAMVYSVGDMYSAAGFSLGDRSAVLDVIFGNRGDWEYLRGQWATLVYRGRFTLRNLEVHAITGLWRENPTLRSDEKGDNFEMYITDSGQLVRYVLNQKFATDLNGSNTVDVKSVWDADIKINTTIDQSLFKVQ